MQELLCSSCKGCNLVASKCLVDFLDIQDQTIECAVCAVDCQFEAEALNHSEFELSDCILVCVTFYLFIAFGLGQCVNLGTIAAEGDGVIFSLGGKVNTCEPG